MRIREANPADATKLAKLIQHVENTSEYILWEAEERKFQPENQRKMLENIQGKNNSTILLAELDNHLVGYLIAIGGNAKRNRHSSYLVIGIHEQARGRGVGTLLFRELDRWAIKNNLHRLELTVVTKNTAGLHLYKKAGFDIEGTKKDSLYINGEYVDEYYMSKLLSNN